MLQVVVGKPFTNRFSCVQNPHALEIRGLLNSIASLFAFKMVIATALVL